MELTDGKKTVYIDMRLWDGHNYSPDFASDFFDGERKVPDVGYCIEQAEDWAHYCGDFYDPEAEKNDKARGIERSVDVTVL